MVRLPGWWDKIKVDNVAVWHIPTCRIYHGNNNTQHSSVPTEDITVLGKVDTKDWNLLKVQTLFLMLSINIFMTLYDYAFLCILDVQLQFWLKTEKCNDKKDIWEINIIFTGFAISDFRTKITDSRTGTELSNGDFHRYKFSLEFY